MLLTKIWKFRQLIVHSFLLALGAFCQMAFIRNLYFELDSEEFSRAILLIGLSTLLPFLDFGLFGATTFSVTGFIRSSNPLTFMEIQWTRRYGAFVVGFSFFVGSSIIFFDSSRDLGLFLILNAILIIGIWHLIAVRSFGFPIFALVATNIQWPIALILSELLKRSTLELDHSYGFIPLFSSIFVTFTLMPICRKILKTRLREKSDGSIYYAGILKSKISLRVTYIFLSAIPLPLILQLDKYILVRTETPSEVNLYAIYMLVFTGFFTLIAKQHVSVTRERLASPTLLSSFADLRLVGLFCSLTYALFGLKFVNDFFQVPESNLPLILLGSCYLFILSIMLYLSLSLATFEFIRIRSWLSWIHFVAWLFLTMLLIPQIGVYAPWTSGIFCAVLHSLAIVIRVREVNAEIYK